MTVVVYTPLRKSSFEYHNKTNPINCNKISKIKMHLDKINFRFFSKQKECKKVKN